MVATFQSTMAACARRAGPRPICCAATGSPHRCCGGSPAGPNVAETMPPAMQWLARQRAAGGELIVIDPRRTSTADAADLHLQPVPGTDLAVATGLLHLLMADGGLDEDFVAARTTRFDEVRRLAAAWWPERVERVSGVAAGRLRQVARRLRDAPTAMIL